MPTASIREQIKHDIVPNGEKRITGQIMQNSLIGMVDNYELNINSALTITDAKIIEATTITPNPDGTFTHLGYIDGQEYEWTTKDLGDYLLIDTEVSGTTGGKTTRFVVSKDGFLVAENAWVKGIIMATDGYFKGSVSADSGYFRGSVSADNGYFKGDVVATSLKIGGEGGKSIEDYVGDIITGSTSGLSGYVYTIVSGLSGSLMTYTEVKAAAISAALNTYIDTTVASASGALADYAKEQADSALTIANTAIAAASRVIDNGDGTYTHIGYIDGEPYTWETKNLGDYILIDTQVSGTSSGVTRKFIVDKQGFLQADNAWIKGVIMATDGYFKGSVSADNGYFRGDVVASSLKLGTQEDKTLEEYIGGVSGSLLSYMGDSVSGLSGDVITYATNIGTSVSGEMMSYAELKAMAVSAALETYARESLESASAALVTYAKEQADSALTIANTAIIAATTVLDNGDGTYSHIGYIDGQPVYWETRDLGDYLIIDSKVEGDLSGETRSFMVSKEGYLQADNAWIKGIIMATDGYFKGSVSAVNGYFQGSVSATSGYFEGDLYADSITLRNHGNISFEDYVTSSTPSSGYINTLISDYCTSQGFIDAVALGEQGYVTAEGVQSWAEENNIMDSAAVSTMISVLSGAMTTNITTASTEDGGIIHTATIGENSYSWVTYDAGASVILGNMVSGTSGGEIRKFLVSKEGLLQADNAWIRGTIFASEGEFNGTVHASGGDFRGSISADSGYFKGDIEANSLILKSGASINFLANNELYLKDSNNVVTAGAKGGDNINFWAGASSADTALWYVSNDGAMTAKKGIFGAFEIGKEEGIFDLTGMYSSGQTHDEDSNYYYNKTSIAPNGSYFTARLSSSTVIDKDVIAIIPKGDTPLYDSLDLFASNNAPLVVEKGYIQTFDYDVVKGWNEGYGISTNANVGAFDYLKKVRHGINGYDYGTVPACDMARRGVFPGLEIQFRTTNEANFSSAGTWVINGVDTGISHKEPRSLFYQDVYGRWCFDGTPFAYLGINIPESSTYTFSESSTKYWHFKNTNLGVNAKTYDLLMIMESTHSYADKCYVGYWFAVNSSLSTMAVYLGIGSSPAYGMVMRNNTIYIEL